MGERTPDKEAIVYPAAHLPSYLSPGATLTRDTLYLLGGAKQGVLKQIKSHIPLAGALALCWPLQIAEDFLMQAEQIHFHKNQL